VDQTPAGPEQPTCKEVSAVTITLPPKDAPVNVSPDAAPDGWPRPFRLRRAAGLVRRAAHVGMAVLTGDRGGRVLAQVCVIWVTREQALRALREMRACGARTVLVSQLADTLTLGATSPLPFIR
jgi:hypothetical protein